MMRNWKWKGTWKYASGENFCGGFGRGMWEAPIGIFALTANGQSQFAIENENGQLRPQMMGGRMDVVKVPWRSKIAPHKLKVAGPNFDLEAKGRKWGKHLYG
jgi:hypothetical protein